MSNTQLTLFPEEAQPLGLGVGLATQSDSNCHMPPRSGAPPCTWPCARGIVSAWSTSLHVGPTWTHRTR